jgi:hypothetical protein
MPANDPDLSARTVNLSRLRHAEPEQVPLKPKWFIQARGTKYYVPRPI